MAGFMNMLEKLAYDFEFIFGVKNSTDVWTLIIIIAMVIISLFTGKKFFKTFFTLFGIVFLLFILNGISPVLMWGLLGGAAVWYVLARCKLPIKQILFWGAVSAGVILALYNFFAWRKSGFFFYIRIYTYMVIK